MNEPKDPFELDDPEEYFGLNDETPEQYFARDPNDIFIGRDRTTGDPEYLNLDLFREHIHCIGRTGTGKTRFLFLIARDLLRRGIGGCLIDPMGGLYHMMEYYVANNPELAKRVVFMNPGERQDPVVAFNPLQLPSYLVEPQSRVDMIREAMMKHLKQSDQAMPRFKSITANLFPALVHEGLTILESKRFMNLQNTAFRDKLLNKLPATHDAPQFWREFFDPMADRDKPGYLEVLINRLNDFVNYTMLKCTVGRTTHLLDFKEIIDHKKLLLVNLRYPGNLSFDAATLIGIFIIQELFYAAMSRHENEGQANPFVLLIDEMQDFITPDIARILDKCRQKGLHLVLAHQRLQQLKNDDIDLYDAVMTNAVTKVIFGVSMADANLLAPEIYELDPNLVKREIYRTTVLDYELEYHTVRSRSSSSGGGSSGGTSQTQVTGASWPLNYSLGGSTSYADAQTNMSGWSDSFSDTEGESEVPMLIPILGQELANVETFPLEEQQSMNAQKLKKQSTAVCTIGRSDLKFAPKMIQVVTIPDPLFDEEAIRKGNKISVHEHPQYYLPITETLEEIETRTKELPGEAAPETDPGAGIGIKPDTDLLGSKIK